MAHRMVAMVQAPTPMAVAILTTAAVATLIAEAATALTQAAMEHALVAMVAVQEGMALALEAMEAMIAVSVLMITIGAIMEDEGTEATVEAMVGINVDALMGVVVLVESLAHP